MAIYHTLKNRYQLELAKLRQKYNAVSTFRLISILMLLTALFYFIKTENAIFACAAIVMAAVFLLLVRWHTAISSEKHFKEALKEINEKEILYLGRTVIPFEDGASFNDFKHPYVHDLDIFGPHSLFQHLNRTFTFIGTKTLADQLAHALPEAQILENQEAVQELAQKLDWRQDFMAFAKISHDSKQLYNTLISWSTFDSTPISRTSTVISFLSPLFLAVSFAAYQFSKAPVFLPLASFFFVFNLAWLGKFYKRIAIEIANAQGIDAIIKKYGLIVEHIEKASFASKKAQALQKQLEYKNEAASLHLKQLSSLFSKMDSINNFAAAVFFNGFFLFHLHSLKALVQWKKDNACALRQWVAAIGEFEMLNSLANFSYNNPAFAYPSLNSKYEISFTGLGHPLLDEKKRVGNDVSFQPQPFMILTGSNMSGKSTFLRSLGINMVLTGIGAPVCAVAANVHPLPVLVSMRLSDSLSESESYFYAEIKRLKQIIDKLDEQRSFVLLDEILRGTNSDDKRSGTIKVVRKMVDKKAIGAIATHDIEVCSTAGEFPGQLANKCFEAAIINDDLHFDYQLYDGICRNKSATFLMEKMGVI
ncbi:MAG TPA: DNA mismatch repair protein [Flavobacterium sp.]|nr:DNA mismatch repair protein [Flavobacterium sp.]